MRRILIMSTALAACSPQSQKASMSSPSPAPAATTEGQAALGPTPEPISAAGIAAPAALSDSPAAALGRRTLSTAFVRIGPDGQLTVELHDGRVVVLRDVVMERKEYCGLRVAGGRYCGDYAQVAAARPGGAPTPVQPDVAANPVKR